MASLATIPHYVFLGVGALSTAVIALVRYSTTFEASPAAQIPVIHLHTALRLHEH